MNSVYKVGDIRALINESSNEFKPVIGSGVESDNKENNEKAYKDAEKRAKDFDGGLKKEDSKNLPDKADYANRTTLDYNPRVKPSKEEIERIEALGDGYNSVSEKNNGIEKAADFSKNPKIVKQFKDANKKVQDERNGVATSGLVSKELDDKGMIDKKPTMYESTTPKPKRLLFKHRRFMNESQMLNLIPEEYKKNGQVIYMEDAHNNEYIVECVQSKSTGTIETQVKSFKNKEMINEQMNRIQELFNYNTRATSGRNTREAQKY